MLEKLSQNFDIEITQRNPRPNKRHTFGMYMDGIWRTLTAKDSCYDVNDPIDSLDVSILQKNVLEPIFNIDDPRTSNRIDFVGGIRGLEYLVEKVDSGFYKVAFAMYPTSMEELIKVADAGEIMPPKSTWFEPKLRDAMVVHMIGEDE